MLTPKENHLFTGHAREIENLSKLFVSSRVPHGFLIAGALGLGKATLAYRLARFILGGGLENAGSGNLFGTPEIDFSMSTTHPVFAKIATGTHPDLMVLETNSEEEKNEITVDDVRKISGFLRLTSAESGWRVVIIDSVDEMNRNAANALLKILEEPTAKSFLILISHSPGRLMPTIKSRCCVLKLNPLKEQEVQEVFSGIKADVNDFAITICEGSPGVALTLTQNKADEIYENFLGIISTMPEPDIEKILEFAEKVSGKNEEIWKITNYLIGRFITLAAKYSVGAEVIFSLPEERMAVEKLVGISSIAKLSELASRLQEWHSSDEIFHLDRRAIMSDIFNLFKKAA